MERKIGEIFEYNGEWYQCVECDSCGKCSLRTTECGSGTKSDLADEVFGECSKIRRSDSKHIIFRKLEKVGEPYTTFVDKTVQNYLLETAVSVPPKDVFTLINNEQRLIAIEIKQNKEDMGEKKLYLKPFDIQKAREGKPVCTRDGRKARIICFDRKFYHDGYNYPIVAMVNNNDNELVHAYTQDGLLVGNKEGELDLMILPEKKEGWAKIRKDINLYDTKEEADRKMIGNDEYVTAKVFWEE